MSDMTQKVGRIRRITESIITLPTLPTVVSKMIQLVDNPKTSAGSLARLISSDQAMTARMLKTANSAYYGFSREISTVDMAIVVMGFDAVKEIGLSLSVLEMFRNAGPDTPFDVTRFWEHSVGCAVASRMLARRYRRDVAGEAFVAGLLHDIGKLILSQYATRDFTNIMELVAHDEATLDEAEQTVLGAVRAGADMLLFGNNLVYQPEIVPRAIDILLRAVEEKELSKARVRRSYLRIKQFKERLP